LVDLMEVNSGRAPPDMLEIVQDGRMVVKVIRFKVLNGGGSLSGQLKIRAG